MKKIGLVGGTGPESTLMYYKELNSRIDKIKDDMGELQDGSMEFIGSTTFDVVNYDPNLIVTAKTDNQDYEVTFTNPNAEGAKQVYFAVWSAVNGQDDVHAHEKGSHCQPDDGTPADGMCCGSHVVYLPAPIINLSDWWEYKR